MKLRGLLFMRSSYRPYDAFCPSVSVCLSSRTVWQLENKEMQKNQNWRPMARVSGVQIFSPKGQRSRSQDVKPPKSGRQEQRRRIKCGRRRLHTGQTPLLGLINCRCVRTWATGRTAAYNFGADISCSIHHMDHGTLSTLYQKYQLCSTSITYRWKKDEYTILFFIIFV